MMFSGLLLPQRNARDLGLEHGLHHLLRRIVGADRDHLGAVDHDVGDGEIAQVEQTAEHVAVLLLDAAFMMQKIDRPAQFLVGGQESPGRPRLEMPNRRRIQRTSASTPISNGPSSRTIQAIGRATSSAIRSGALIATVLGSTSVKTTTTTVMIMVA